MEVWVMRFVLLVLVSARAEPVRGRLLLRDGRSLLTALALAMTSGWRTRAGTSTRGSGPWKTRTVSSSQRFTRVLVVAPSHPSEDTGFRVAAFRLSTITLEPAEPQRRRPTL